MNKVLIINAHQRYEGISEGKLNKTLVDVMHAEFESNGYDVAHTVIEQCYDIEEEINKHEWADVVITQTPVYWFGTPWIYKKYIDEVFTSAYVQQRLLEGDGRIASDPSKKYGSGGKMQGKKYMLSLTWNAPEEAFNNPEQPFLKGGTAGDVFQNNTNVYKFCGAEVIPEFSCYNVMLEPAVEEYALKLKHHLNQLF